MVERICTERNISKEAIQSTMGKIWKLNRIASFKEAEKNLFIITFSTDSEKQRVVRGKPWLFDNALFALQSLDGSKLLAKTVFDFEHFWIQLHGLPIRYMTRYYGELIPLVRF